MAQNRLLNVHRLQLLRRRGTESHDKTSTNTDPHQNANDAPTSLLETTKHAKTTLRHADHDSTTSSTSLTTNDPLNGKDPAKNSQLGALNNWKPAKRSSILYLKCLKMLSTTTTMARRTRPTLAKLLMSWLLMGLALWILRGLSFPLLNRCDLQPVLKSMGLGGIVNMANSSKRNLNVKGLKAIDLRKTRPDGQYWDLSLKIHRRETLRLIDTEQPDWVIVGPPCTQFSSLNNWLNHKKMGREKLDRHMKEAIGHLRFACRLYKRQLARGRWLLHEHPLTASSWQTPEIKALRVNPRVGTTTCHQCMFGILTPGDDGSIKAAKKPTRFMPNSPYMLNEITRLCTGHHEHQHLVAGRAKAAETIRSNV